MDFGIALAIIIGFGLGLLFVVSRGQKPRKKVIQRENLNKQVVGDRWAEIEKTFALGGPSQFKSAIMEADKLVDHVLKGLSVPGETMGERLKSAKKKFSSYDDYNNLWYAHKVRNNIAHEISHEINSAEAKKAMDYFRKALKVLGMI